MNITIRKATINDLQTLLDINYASYEANVTYDPYILMDWIHTDDAKKYFIDSLTKEGYYSAIACIDEIPVGYIILVPKDFGYRTIKTIELDNFAVLPAYRSKGVGKMLLDNAKKWAKNNGYQTIYALSYSKNKRAISIYQREGFEQIDVGLELTLK